MGRKKIITANKIEILLVKAKRKFLAS